MQHNQVKINFYLKLIRNDDNEKKSDLNLNENGINLYRCIEKQGSSIQETETFFMINLKK